MLRIFQFSSILFFFCISPGSFAATEVSYHNGLIRFQFAEDYPTGQFANGDYWVHNNGEEIIITQTLPASENSQGRTKHGTMVNPANSSNQGYDSSPRDMSYDSGLNVDPGNTGQPLVISPSTSVIKSISMASDAGRPIISDAAILTVLSSPPPSGSFRPPYTGTDKSILARLQDLDYSQLGRFPPLGGEPSLTEIAARYNRVWLEHCTSWVQRDIHPLNNMPTYGRDIARSSSDGLILLQLDYTEQEKESILIGLVQYGIDLYGIARESAAWNANGGHNLGRKMVLLLAARVLNSHSMLAYADKEQHFIFQDDQQHFYISQDEVDRTHCIDCSVCSDCWDPDDRAEAIPYEQDDIGTAEWGIRHLDRPKADNANWQATYRHTNGAAQVSQVFAALLMGVQHEWNWPPLFDYADRYFSLESERLSDYVVALWNAYRGELLYRPDADLNGDGTTDLADAIISLQVLTNNTSQQIRSDYTHSGTDVDGGNRVSLDETIFALKRASLPSSPQEHASGTH